jgi:hypothetical protein
MKKNPKVDPDLVHLPAPVALDPEQLEQVAGGTAETLPELIEAPVLSGAHAPPPPPRQNQY